MEESQLIHCCGKAALIGRRSIMKATSVVILAGMLVVPGSTLYAQGGAQASSSASGSTSVQADKSGAKASSNTSASTSAKAGQSSASLSSGTAMNATLSQPVDAKKNKPGDQVTAKTTEATKSEGKVVIPKGSKLVGHVTECKQRSKEEKESALGIVFDKAMLKNGEEIPLNVTIRALAAAQTAAASSVGGDELSGGGGAVGSARASRGGALGGVRCTRSGQRHARIRARRAAANEFHALRLCRKRRQDTDRRNSRYRWPAQKHTRSVMPGIHSQVRPADLSHPAKRRQASDAFTGR